MASVYGHVMTQKLKISSLQWCCNVSFCPHNSVYGTLWPQNWKFHHYNIVAISCFVLITRFIFDLMTCAIPLCKALTDGFISSMTPKNSDQVTGTLWPKNWKFHHYNGAAMSHFVLITRSILDLTTCAIPLCKALTMASYDTQELWPSYGTLWPQNWKFHHYNIVAHRFVLITRSIFNLTTCAIPLCKALTDGFILSMTPKNSDQVTGTLWPKNWKFHHYNIVAMSHFVLITRSILDLTTCAIPLCKALTNGFILSMTPKNSGQVMGRYDPKTENFIITILLRYHVLCS